MAFVFAHNVSTVHRRTMPQAVRRVAARFHRALNLTPEERANLYVSRMPIAVVTASLGGHPVSDARSR
jgi:lipoate synthase